MPAPRPSRVQQVFTNTYVESPHADALRAEADRLAVGVLRLYSPSPSVIYLADDGAAASLDQLAAFASVLFGVPVKVLALASLPAWRRERAWSSSVPLGGDPGTA